MEGRIQRINLVKGMSVPNLEKVIPEREKRLCNLERLYLKLVGGGGGGGCGEGGGGGVGLGWWGCVVVGCGGWGGGCGFWGGVLWGCVVGWVLEPGMSLKDLLPGIVKRMQFPYA